MEILEQKKINNYRLELMISNAVFLSNCPNNPHMKPAGSKKNYRVFNSYQRRLIRKINKGAFEVSVWDKIAANKKTRKIM